MEARRRELAELRALHQRQLQMRAEYARWVGGMGGWAGVSDSRYGLCRQRHTWMWYCMCGVARSDGIFPMDSSACCHTHVPSSATSTPALLCPALGRHRMELAAQLEEERRQQLTNRLAAKHARVAAMEEEKAQMLRALAEVRREIRQQEEALK